MRTIFWAVASILVTKLLATRLNTRVVRTRHNVQSSSSSNRLNNNDNEDNDNNQDKLTRMEYIRLQQNNSIAVIITHE